MEVALQVCSATKLVVKGTGVKTVQLHAPVLMVHSAIPQMDSANVRMQVAASAILVGLAPTALCLVAIFLGEDLVTIPVYVDPMVCVIR